MRDSRSCGEIARTGHPGEEDQLTDETAALDSVLQQAHVARMSAVNGFGANREILVDLSDPAESTQLRTAMAVESLPGFTT